MRDPLDRWYTPDALASACVAAVAAEIEASGPPRTILEPSVGGGAFARAIRTRWPDAHLTGVDLDPRAAGLALCERGVVANWCGLQPRPRADLVVGNPPFTSDVALAHVRAALGASLDWTILILPLAFVGVGRWESLFDAQRPALVCPILPRAWPCVRETALYGFRRGFNPPFSRIWPIRWADGRQTKAPGRSSVTGAGVEPSRNEDRP